MRMGRNYIPGMINIFFLPSLFDFMDILKYLTINFSI